jgi:hypothetical protein
MKASYEMLLREHDLRRLVRQVLLEMEGDGVVGDSNPQQTIQSFETKFGEVLKLKNDVSKQKPLMAALTSEYLKAKQCSLPAGDEYALAQRHTCQMYEELAKKLQINLIDYKQQLLKDVKVLAQAFNKEVQEEELEKDSDEYFDLLKEMYREQILEKYYEIWVKLKKSCRAENYENVINNNFIDKYEMLLKAYRGDESEYGLFRAIKELITGKQVWYNKK